MQSFVKGKREISSAGSEHLPYKQGVTGSNPVSPTKKSRVYEVNTSQTLFSCKKIAKTLRRIMKNNEDVYQRNIKTTFYYRPPIL